MKILINKISNLLSDKISLVQRGILITILLLKEDDPKLTLAKVKSKLNMQANKEDLIHLHKAGLINWSEYNKAVKTLKDKEILPEVIEIIDFMNGLYGTGFKSTTKSYQKAIAARLKESSLDELKLVVANRYKVWKDDPVMSKYLTPDTVFRASKFPKYLVEANRTKEGESLLSASKIGLKKGDLITLDLANRFSDDDIYKVTSFHLDGGNRVGSGQFYDTYGRDIKRSLRVQENRGVMEVEYVYEGN